MLLGYLVGAALVAPHPFDFYGSGPYDSRIPKPESILGYGPGERQSTYRDQEQVVDAIAKAASDRVTKIRYGQSVEGRPLRVFAITSPENLKRLDAIRADQELIAEGKPAKDPNPPAVIWINECIHGDEPASFESAMWLLYNLAASRDGRIVDALKRVVVILNPSYNPDGHERFAVWSNSVAVGSASPDSPEHHEPQTLYGRLNHYKFDMNRDRVSMSQQETQQEVAEYLQWHPEVYVDQHGQVSSYFMPPNPMSVNAEVDRGRLNKWTDALARGVAKAFDAEGWQYYVKDEFDLYYAGYLDSWSCLNGAIGMTNETDGGYQIVKTRPDGSSLTLRDGIAKHFTAAVSYIETGAAMRHELVASYLDFRSAWASGKAAGKFQRVVVEGSAPQLSGLKHVLQIQGVKSSFCSAAFSQADAHNYWTGKTESQSFPPGSLIVDIAQPQGAVAKAMLEPGQDFEPDFVKEQVRRQANRQKTDSYEPDTAAEFYDVTGWSLIYDHELKAWWCESAPPVARADMLAAMLVGGVQESTIGWSLPYHELSDVLAIYDLMDRGVRVQINPKPMKLGDRTYDAGEFLILKSRNDDLEADLKAVAIQRGVRFLPIASGYPELDRFGPGSENVRSLRRPEIGVLFMQGDNPTNYGGIWFAMEKVFKLPFTPLMSLSGDLSKYSCIVIPDDFFAAPPAKLSEWIADGGCAIALGSVQWANSNFCKLEDAKVDSKQPAYMPGSIFLANLEPRSPLSYGYKRDADGQIPLAVLVSGNQFFKAKHEGGAAIKFSSDPKFSKLLSGWEWPNDTEPALTDAVWLQEERVGRGTVLMFASDPTDRALYPGLYKVLLNGMLLEASN